jgi:hypothetical protein
VWAAAAKLKKELGALENEVLRIKARYGLVMFAIRGLFK